MKKLNGKQIFNTLKELNSKELTVILNDLGKHIEKFDDDLDEEAEKRLLKLEKEVDKLKRGKR